jgi:hypothetical protein
LIKIFQGCHSVAMERDVITIVLNPAMQWYR